MDNKKAAFSGSLAIERAQAHSTMPTPAPNSQNAEILAILQSGQSLTSHEMHIMGIQGAQARILELRRMGYCIVTTMERHINKHGKIILRGRYHLAASGKEAGA